MAEMNVSEAEKIGFLTPEYYGAKGDGVSDDTDAVMALFRAMEAYKKPAYAFGNYRLGGPVQIDGYTADFDLKMTAHAAFVAGEYATAAVQIKGDVSKKRRFFVDGGTFDTTNSIFGAATGTGTGLALTRFWSGNINRVLFICRRVWPQSLYGDSGTSAVDIYHMSVTNSVFDGHADLGIYWSGNSSLLSSDDGGECVFTGNIFRNNSVGIGLKRQFSRCVIASNFFENSGGGISVTFAGSVPPGGEMIIANNILHGVRKRPIRLQSTGGMPSQIIGNRVIDYGFDVDGETPFGPRAAILLEGGSGHQVLNNMIEQRDLEKTDDHAAIRLIPYTINGETSYASDVQVSGNRATNVGCLIREDPGCGYTRGEGNILRNVTTPAQFDHAKSWVGFSDEIDPHLKKIVGAPDFGVSVNGVMQ